MYMIMRVMNLGHAIKDPAKSKENLCIEHGVSTSTPKKQDMVMKTESITKKLPALLSLFVFFGVHAFADSGSDELKSKVAEIKERLDSISPSQDGSSTVHLAGYGSVNYVKPEDGDGAFNKVLVAPIFHFNYEDWMMFETEFEVLNTDDGGTEFALEYASLDIFLNDYVTLVAGKFLSPLGQFRQNIHPSWINKMVETPAGFGHGGAVPLSETGLQLRGGFPINDMRANYAVYVGNGPTLGAAVEEEDGDFELAIEEIESEGSTGNSDGKSVMGGRFGLIPIEGLEIGLSLAKGQATVTKAFSGGHDGPALEIANSQKFDYQFNGADFRYGIGHFELRGEYANTEIAGGAGGVQFHDDDLPDGYMGPASFDDVETGEWVAWYLQGSYRLKDQPIELVVRSSELETPHVDENYSQYTLGINYLFAPSVIAKFNFEKRDPQSAALEEQNTLRLQLSYGF